jgi:hypothetical protein
MINAPTMVRLLRFPTTLRLTRSGKIFRSPLRRSGPVVLSERQAAVIVTLRVTMPGVTFATGSNEATVQEAFSEGEQRDVLLPWALEVDAKQRIPQVVLEIDLAYEDSPERHTGTVPINLTYGVKKRVVVGAALAAAAVAAAASASRRRKLTAPVTREEVVVAVPPARKQASPSKKKAASSKKATAARKAAPSKKASSKTAAKKTSAKKSSATKSSKASSKKSTKRR